MQPVTELELKEFIHNRIQCEYNNETLIVDEFVIGEIGRIDIVSIGEELIGYELKSDLDTLARLPRQMGVYSEIFGYCILVVTPRHLIKAKSVVQKGWGLAVVERKSGGELFYKQIRKAHPLKTGNKFTISTLLWRDELIKILDDLEIINGYRGATRSVLAKRLAENTDLEQLRAIVARTLMARQGWRVDQAQRGCVERSQPRGGFSRFLARRFDLQYR